MLITIPALCLLRWPPSGPMVGVVKAQRCDLPRVGRICRDGRSRRQRLLGFPDGCAAKDLQPEPLTGPVLQQQGCSSPGLPESGSGPPGAGGMAAGAQAPTFTSGSPPNPCCPDIWDQVPLGAPLGAKKLLLQPRGVQLPPACPQILLGMLPWAGAGDRDGSCDLRRGSGDPLLLGGDPSVLCALGEGISDLLVALLQGGSTDTTLLHWPRVSLVGAHRKEPPRHPRMGAGTSTREAERSPKPPRRFCCLLPRADNSDRAMAGGTAMAGGDARAGGSAMAALHPPWLQLPRAGLAKSQGGDVDVVDARPGRGQAAAPTLYRQGADASHWQRRVATGQETCATLRAVCQAL